MRSGFEVVVYLPHYDSKVRKVYRVFGRNIGKQQLKDILNDFMRDYGSKWRDSTQRKVRFKISGGKSYQKWEKKEVAMLMLMRQQGRIYFDIAKNLGRTVSSVMSKYYYEQKRSGEKR